MLMNGALTVAEVLQHCACVFGGLIRQIIMYLLPSISAEYHQTLGKANCELVSAAF